MILSIGRAKLEYAAQQFFLPKEECMERRGGSKKVTTNLMEAIINHIQSFKVCERHYGRNSTVGRVYLPAELNVRAMHRMFLEKPEYAKFSECKYNFYYEIFQTNFNIGFGTIRKDTCSTCEQYTNLLKNSDEINKKEFNYSSRKEILVERMLHRVRYKRFFKELELAT